MAERKERLDRLLVQKNLIQSRERARARIMAGEVLVNHLPVDKPGAMVLLSAHIALKGTDIPYVSRGGLKLEAAINELSLNIHGMDCLDIGASTGGFTDCLLQHGASQVFAVDVGYGQLAWKLRQDPRVHVLERTNIRHLSPETLETKVDLVTIDVSFISLKIVVPEALKFMKNKASILALIKPQFEVGRGRVGKGGIVRDRDQHQIVIRDLSTFFQEIQLIPGRIITSPILGSKGNREFIIHLYR